MPSGPLDLDRVLISMWAFLPPLLALCSTGHGCDPIEYGFLTGYSSPCELFDGLSSSPEGLGRNDRDEQPFLAEPFQKGFDGRTRDASAVFLARHPPMAWQQPRIGYAYCICNPLPPLDALWQHYRHTCLTRMLWMHLIGAAT